MDESAGVVIIEIENMTPDMKRDVVVQFFTVDGSAIGTAHSIAQSPNSYFLLQQMEMTSLVFKTSSRTLSHSLLVKARSMLLYQ